MCVCGPVRPCLSSDTIPSHLLPVICSPWPFFNGLCPSLALCSPSKDNGWRRYCSCSMYLLAKCCFVFVLFCTWYYSKYRTCETKMRQLGDTFARQSLITAFTCWYIYRRLKVRFLIMPENKWFSWRYVWVWKNINLLWFSRIKNCEMCVCVCLSALFVCIKGYKSDLCPSMFYKVTFSTRH